jgi:cytochrome c5
VYGQICKTCHEAGIAGAPKAGDKAAWAPRVAQGEKTMVQHAIAGFQGKTGVMPPKGGNMDLTDDEVHRAVVYLANQVGRRLEGTAADRRRGCTGSGGCACRACASRTCCDSCAWRSRGDRCSTGGHGSRSAGRRRRESRRQGGLRQDLQRLPRDRPRRRAQVRRQGRVGASHRHRHPDAAQRRAQGLNAMPPRGGNMALSDAEVTAAADYMVGAAK